MANTQLAKQPENSYGFQPGVSGNPHGRPLKEDTFVDLCRIKLLEICPYDPLHRRYIDYMVAQTIEDATDGSSVKWRTAAREFLVNRVWGLPRATIDTRLEIDAHINADALEMALRPILEAQQSMIARYREASIEGTYTLLPSDEVQSSITSETPELASK